MIYEGSLGSGGMQTANHNQRPRALLSSGEKLSEQFVQLHRCVCENGAFFLVLEPIHCSPKLSCLKQCKISKDLLDNIFPELVSVLCSNMNFILDTSV